ncbi:hypothetical protein DIPPA_19871 [Diplonema papillatum]|nr:hypothetical protein DIPPA_19871 [Diplonema papillatum]
MCGFVKVLLPHEDTDISLFAFSLDRTRIHPLFYSMVYNMALSMAVGLGKMERHAVAGLSDAEYDAKMTDVIEDMMEDVEICRKRQMIEQADLLQIEWEVMKDDWNRMYGSVGDFVSSPDAAEMFDSVRVPELMQVIRDELMQPYGLRAEPGDDLFPMAEYKPLADDAVFDTLTDDPSLQKGAVRIVSVSSTSISGVRVRIAGCDAARGLISKSETAPGSVYSESEWSLYRDQWFKKGTQLEAVVSHVVKGNFLVRLTILPDAIKSAKMKVDKSYREMEKNLRRREREALGGSQTLSQTQETASQTATLKTLSLTDDRTATSIVDSAFDNPNNAVQQDLGIALHVPEPDGGALLSHPLYIPSIETYEQAEKKLVDVEPTTGRPYFKPGELLLRPDLRTKKKTRFRLSMRLLDHPACDTRNLLGHGKNFVFAQTGFLHLAFELRGMLVFFT